MRIPNIVFWALLAIIAVFYVIKGNDMHKEKIQIRMDNKEESKIVKEYSLL